MHSLYLSLPLGRSLMEINNVLDFLAHRAVLIIRYLGTWGNRYKGEVSTHSPGAAEEGKID